MRLTFTPQAELDLEDIADYIAADSPARALSFVVKLRVQCRRIIHKPSGYRRRPELGNDIRSCPYGNYVIFFAASETEVLVVRILHAARDIRAQFDSPE
jgi:toxin ParE1/3/4